MRMEWKNDAEFIAALKRAEGLIGPIGSARDVDHSAMVKVSMALVDLVAIELRAGERKPGRFLSVPQHLPQEDAELRMVYESTAAQDRRVRADVVEWGKINARVGSDNADMLRVPIIACNLARSAAEDESVDEATRQDAWDRLTEIRAYVRQVFGVEPDVAPRGDGSDNREIDQWCLKAMTIDDPTPNWLWVTAQLAHMSELAQEYKGGSDEDS